MIGRTCSYVILCDRAWNRFLAEVIIPEAFEAGYKCAWSKDKGECGEKATNEFLTKIIEQ